MIVTEFFVVFKILSVINSKNKYKPVVFIASLFWSAFAINVVFSSWFSVILLSSLPFNFSVHAKRMLAVNIDMS